MDTKEMQSLLRLHENNAQQIIGIERALWHFSPANEYIKHFACRLEAKQGTAPADVTILIDPRAARGFFEIALDEVKSKQFEIENKIRDLAK